MALYIKLQVGDELIAVFGIQRQEALKDKNIEYTYKANKYKKFAGGFTKSDEEKIIKHRYSDKAEVLAEKVLQAFNQK